MKPQINWGMAKRLLAYIAQKNKILLVIVAVCIVISSLANVVSTTFIQSLIDDHIAPMLAMKTQNLDYSGLLFVITQMGGMFLICMFASLFYQRLMVTISQGVLKRLRDEMFARMQRLPISYFDQNSYGDVMSRYTNDTDALRQMISQTIPQTLASILMIVSVTITMLILNVYLTIVVFAVVFLMLLVTRKISSLSATHFVEVQRSLGDVNGFIEEMINGQKIIKVFTHEEQTKVDFDQKNDTLYDHASAGNRYANILMPIMGNIGNAQYVLIAMIGGAMAINGFGGVSLGDIAAFLTLSRSFAQPIGQLSMQINAVIMALAGAARVFALMDEPVEKDEGYVTLVNAKWDDGNLVESDKPTGLWAWKHPHGDGSLTYTEVKGHVTLNDVDFEYMPGKPVLRDVSIFAKPGQKIAFVGATGAGKTTITNLINRFYDIADGKIRIDDININKIQKNALRRSLGIVLQDVNLFTGTVRENIRYGRLDSTDEEVEHAAKLANAHDFIMRLPKGYDTEIEGDGGQLSQGQRQLLSIARAAVADPPVMILDEATSSIDTRTEAIVQKGMDNLMEGRTVIVIAHRLSTIQNADAIMVLENGSIIERGSHESLLKEKGKYYQLYTGVFATQG
ncbi:MAG: ABC transporter ATP-binding protein/permease [Clostridiales bacterium]|jgi:ATP-binding cassette subfamily B protein|nr:ABC transporter ATP-binding protein/permease [Clostridiales bacterium]